jgi:flagellar biosynthetic protein FliR
MSIELVGLLSLLERLVWPLLRIGAFLLTSPLFSIDAFSVRLRVAMAVVLAVFVLETIPVPELEMLGAEGLAAAVSEVFTGFVLGLCLQIVSAALALGGAAISNSMGLSFANIVDPAMGNIPVISQLFIVLATMVFLGMNGHLLLVGLLLESFSAIPVGTFPDAGAWYDIMLRWSPAIFAAGLGLALPVVIALLVINLGLGIVTRAAPAMNIFSVGFPALLIGGFVFLFFALPGLSTGIQTLWSRALETASLLLGG